MPTYLKALSYMTYDLENGRLKNVILYFFVAYMKLHLYTTLARVTEL